MMGCGSCGGTPARRLAGGGKGFGSCPLCLVIAGLGTFAGWTFYLSFTFLAPGSAILEALLAVASAFSGLLSAHVLGFFLRRRKERARARSVRLTADP